MGLRDIMRKKDQLAQGGGSDEVVAEQTVRRLQGPEFGFLRTDSLAPDPPSVSPSPRHLSATVRHAGHSPARRSLDVLRRASRSRSTSASSQGSQRDGEQADAEGEPATAGHAGGGRSRNRLSQRLHHLRRRTGEPRRSDSVPEDLPEIVVGATGDADEAPQQHHQEEEAQWEWRATLLAERNEEVRPGSPSPAGGGLRMGSSRAIDGDIQVAIRLHEQGHLAESTALFGALADPAGANNPLSQVLYGLALRCVRSVGWLASSSSLSHACPLPFPFLSTLYSSDLDSLTHALFSLAATAGAAPPTPPRPSSISPPPPPTPRPSRPSP